VTDQELLAQFAAMEQRILAAVKPEGSEYLTAEEAAAYLRLSERQLRDSRRLPSPFGAATPRHLPGPTHYARPV